MLDHANPNSLEETTTEVHPTAQCLLPLLYFEIFSYPLTVSEIHQFSSDLSHNLAKTQEQLNKGVKAGYLFCIDDFYLLQNKPEWVRLRQENNQRAKRYINRAYWVTSLIRRFPFVRGVFLSGALSKNVMPKDGDIDYFIITRPGRLWVSRTLLILFKKLFLFNSHKYFCVNYFISENNLEIEAKNRYTATEIATLIPLYNPKLYEQFLDANQWIKTYFPNFAQRDTQRTLQERPSNLQRPLEWLLVGKMGDKLDNYFLEKTLAFWQKKFADFDPAKFTNALKSKKDVSKHHPLDFQTKVMNGFVEKIKLFEQKHGVNLLDE